MRQETADYVLALIDQMKRAAKSPEVDGLSDEMAALVRESIVPTMDGPRIQWVGRTMHVL